METKKFILEGVDRVGKDTIASAIQDSLGYHLVLHYSKPLLLNAYQEKGDAAALEQYQNESFHGLFAVLDPRTQVRVICNRAHLGEAVYAPLYRGYSGDYIFEMEAEKGVNDWKQTCLVLLWEDLGRSSHFVDDGRSLGTAAARRDEQELFHKAFERSLFPNKRLVPVTRDDGKFRRVEDVLADVLR